VSLGADHVTLVVVRRELGDRRPGVTPEAMPEAGGNANAVADGEVEIRYVIPTTPAAEADRFCHLRSDYRDHVRAVEGLAPHRHPLRSLRSHILFGDLPRNGRHVLASIVSPEPSTTLAFFL